MKAEVLMPKMGESITEGRILKWLKKPGETIDKDETVLEIATDKVDTEVPSPVAGVIVELLYAEGDTVDVGKPIAYIETDAGAAVVVQGISGEQGAEQHAVPVTPAAPAPSAPMSPAAQPASASMPAATHAAVSVPPSPGTAQQAAADGGVKRFYSPVVMRIASEHGIGSGELAGIPGSGGHGRVTKADLLAYIERRSAAPSAAPSPAAPAPMPIDTAVPAAAAGQGVEIIPMDNIRRLMAEHMIRSKQISPHVALAFDVDMTRIARFRDTHAQAFKSREGISLTFMPFIAQAAIRALKDFPYVNASVDGTNILLKHFVNLGIAVAMDDGGLIVPVIKHADTLNVVGLARAIADVAQRARTRRLAPDEITEGTFTLTNFGVFGSSWGIPIINQPQVAILGIGTLEKKPVVVERDGEDVIAIRSMMTLTLSFDHRIVDGALGSRFLGRVKAYLEDFQDESI